MNAIRVADLSKQYRLGETDFGRRSLYHALAERLARRPRTRRPEGPETIWALDDVSFEVAAGEAVGIVGANGAGKSTLLKVLSRITAPTRGRAEYCGRLASLLEVGTGFHGELTGRDNVYLNGAILGMSRAEIAGKFDSIVDFSGVEAFLDTPVKRYSSGMQVRLAFAVAAHIDPDILIVDEVLAVGDSAFRAKCLDRLDETARSGRTVLLVSHDLAAIEGLTTRCLLLERGHLVADGETGKVVGQYLEGLEQESNRPLAERERGGTGECRVVAVDVLDASGRRAAVVRCGEPVTFRIELQTSISIDGVAVHVGIYDHLGRSVALLESDGGAGMTWRIDLDRQSLDCRVESLPVPPGRYRLNVAVLRGSQLIDGVAHAKGLTVEASDFFGTGRLPKSGSMLLRATWQESAGARHPSEAPREPS